MMQEVTMALLFSQDTRDQDLFGVHHLEYAALHVFNE